MIVKLRPALFPCQDYIFPSMSDDGLFRRYIDEAVRVLEKRHNFVRDLEEMFRAPPDQLFRDLPPASTYIKIE